MQKLEDAVKKARQNREWRREYMTLLMRDQENQEKGKEIGMEIGIYEVISTYREVEMSDYDISRRLQQKFHLSKERAEEYMKVGASI